MSFQYTCEECGIVFIGKANFRDPSKPHPSYYRKKNASFHYCPPCQYQRYLLLMKQWHRQHAPQYNQRARKQLFRNGIELAKYEWSERVQYYDGEPAPYHVMWDFFPARLMDNGEKVPVINLIGTVTDNDLVTQNSNGEWIRPRAIRKLKKDCEYYDRTTRKRHQSQKRHHASDDN